MLNPALSIPPGEQQGYMTRRSPTFFYREEDPFAVLGPTQGMGRRDMVVNPRDLDARFLGIVPYASLKGVLYENFGSRRQARTTRCCC